MLYFRLKAWLESHCQIILNEIQSQNNVDDDAQFLRSYYQQFERYSSGMKYGAELFTYLNRYWIKQAHEETGQTPIAGVLPVYEVSTGYD